MKEYIKNLYDKMYAVMERPMTLGRVEEVGEYADTICKLEKLHKHNEANEGEPEFTQKTARKWVERMENEDGTTGAHWTKEQTEAVRKASGREYPACIWWAAMNMCYSDYYGVAVKHGVNKPEFYADLADAFLDDKDADGAEEKISAYYHCIAS